MGLFDIWKSSEGLEKRNVLLPAALGGVSRPVEMQFRFLPNGQVIWYAADQGAMLEYGYLDNHVVFTVANWKANKIASIPPILYAVKDKREYKKYRLLLSDATPESLEASRYAKYKALEEVENPEIMKIFEQPNPHMRYKEFAYGTIIYKDFVGCAYWDAVRSGSVNDPTVGKIKELYLPHAHQRRIKSGGPGNPVDKYFSVLNPDKYIDAKNVYQFRNFNPQNTDGTGTQFLYGLSRLHPARKILQKYNEGTEAEANLLQKKGMRDIVFPKNLPDNTSPSYEGLQKTRDAWDRKINDSEPASILLSEGELGSIRVGFSPVELGLDSSQKTTKEDFCALFNISPMIFGWASNTTYTNFPEARRMAITDAIIPELEDLKDAYNSFYMPSYDDSGKYVIDFDLEALPEMQSDMEKTVKWMKAAGAYTTNEIRLATRYGVSKEINADKIIVSSGSKLLENVGLESFPGDPDSIDIIEEKE